MSFRAGHCHVEISWHWPHVKYNPKACVSSNGLLDLMLVWGGWLGVVTFPLWVLTLMLQRFKQQVLTWWEVSYSSLLHCASLLRIFTSLARKRAHACKKVIAFLLNKKEKSLTSGEKKILQKNVYLPFHSWPEPYHPWKTHARLNVNSYPRCTFLQRNTSNWSLKTMECICWVLLSTETY